MSNSSTSDPKILFPRRRDSREVGAGLPHNTETPDIETSSLAYAARFHGPTGQWLLESQTRALVSLLRQVQGQQLRILELGGGHAQLAPMLLQHGYHVVVQGSSADSLSRIEPLTRQFPDRFETCVASLWELPYDDRAFDMVIAVRLLGHVTRWRELLHEMTRVANRFVLVEFARSRAEWTPELQKAVFWLKQRFERTTRPFFMYKTSAVTAELGRCGFRLTGETAQFAVPMVLHRLLRSRGLSTLLEDGLRTAGLGVRYRSPAMLLAQRVTADDDTLGERGLFTDGAEAARAARVALTPEPAVFPRSPAAGEVPG